MALEPIAMQAIIDECKDGKPRRLLSLGYPDILAMPGQFDDIPERDDAEQVRSWHHWPHRVPDTDKAFAALKVEPVYVDVAKVRGPEKVLDLNSHKDHFQEFFREWQSSNEEGYEGRTVTVSVPDSRPFDLVLDPGTTEHIFNIGNAFECIKYWCAVGGLVIHTNPLNQANHGFWSINPTAYIDWYEANGFRLEKLMEMAGRPADRVVRNAHTVKRFDALENSVLYCQARKIRDASAAWPLQAKYRANPKLQGAA